ncbi:MAG: cold shock domain-containing protein, partial [Pirellulales bacterium]
MPEGKIKKVVSEKGFGFIDGERGDLFFHHSELQDVTIEQLVEGQVVQYEVG